MNPWERTYLSLRSEYTSELYAQKISDKEAKLLRSVSTGMGWKGTLDELPFSGDIVRCRGIENLKYFVASTMYPPDAKEGLSSEQIIASPFQNILHGLADLDNLYSILDDNHIIPLMDRRPDNNRTDQYPGTYFRLKQASRKPVEEGFNAENDFVLVFSLALLRRKDWHANLIESFGSFTKHTFDSVTLSEYLGEGYQGNDIEEIVFHNAVSLDYCEAIVVNDGSLLGELKSTTSIPVYTRGAYAAREYAKSLTRLYRPLTDNYLPNFFYCDSGEEGQLPSIRTLRATLLNGGFSQDQAQHYINTLSHKELIDVITNLWPRNRSEGKIYPVVVHPPY